MELTNSGIGEKVCKTRAQSNKKYGEYAAKTGDKSSGPSTSLCSDDGGTSGSSTDNKAQYLKEFVEKTLLNNGSKNWPTSTKSTGAESDTKNDNAQEVAKDLTKLTTEEKTIVAGLLAKTIEGVKL
ncbi:putative p44-77 outer membrane protein, silent [Anaplasma phagocytophilum str. ApNP]|uniref:Putative p44-77 outer membrane protein, silent n=1 Tax=Anaplasma phagocytophilum str. ApNP TaxID=1359153 RepID=A0A0F3NJL7_ANAPH|nr:putative p44-77 outer membrane protein, silent [Anaplasma phagocytophilum str. ApNP]